MCELPTVTGKQAIAAFERAGFTVARTSGSHCIMKREGHRFTLSVPVHGNKDLKPGLLRSLIRTADLTKAQFIELLNQ